MVLAKVRINMRLCGFSFVMLCLLSACGALQNPFDTTASDFVVESDLKPSLPKTSEAQHASEEERLVAELDELFSLPELNKLMAQYEAADAKLASVKASQGFTISGSSDLGARNTQNDEFIATASLVGQKSLNLQSENDLNLKILSYQKDMITVEIRKAIDNILGQVLNYEISLAHLQQMRTISDKYRKIYDENKPALEAAIAAGVVSSSEKFKFRKTLANNDRRLHEAEAANALLKLNIVSYQDKIPTKYLKVIGENNNQLASLALSSHELPEIEKLKLQVGALEAEQELIRAQKKPLGAVVTRLTSPASSDKDWTAFVGLNLTLPVFDNGEKSFLLDEKAAQINAIEASASNYLMKNNDSKAQLERFVQDAEISLAMLKEEQALSSEIIGDLKTRLGYGGANISDLVSEILALADLELQVADKERQVKSRVIDYAITYGTACVLSGVCDTIAGSVKQVGNR